MRVITARAAIIQETIEKFKYFIKVFILTCLGNMIVTCSGAERANLSSCPERCLTLFLSLTSEPQTAAF